MSSSQSRLEKAEIVREYGPFPDIAQVHGVTYDGALTWIGAGTHLQAFDPATGETVKQFPVNADAGTAFDGRHFYQLTGEIIQKIDAHSGQVLGSIPSPGKGRDSGLAWAEGKLWVGQYLDRKIHCIDADTGEILKTIESDRYVTGVSWVDGELWHGTMEDEKSELRRVEPGTGAVLERLEMPRGAKISGLESDGKEIFFCGGGKSGKVRAVRRPRR
ncbi:MAG TPA: glutamine cyclotransferase [Polyangiaceae bacterium]|jgi:glutamine cyclotransferase